MRKQSFPKVRSDIGLTFDDVLLLPRLVSHSRADVDLVTTLAPGIVLSFPVISSPMDTVTEVPMAIAMAQAGGLGIIHRNLSVADQAAMVALVKKTKPVEGSATDGSGRLLVGAGVGAGSDLSERVAALIKAGCDVIAVDSAHGGSKPVLDAVKFVKKQKKSQVVLAGSTATVEVAKALIAAGADILRVGIGPGSICTTRIVTGIGVPQITAIMDAAAAAKGKKVTVLADGGIRQMGDVAKALAAGAHAVMLGSMLAGYEQSPGEIITVDGRQMKRYRGMGSAGAMKKGAATRYGQSADTAAKKLIPEGVEGLVAFKGGVEDFLHQVIGSLRSSFFYSGSRTMAEFHEKSQFIRMSPSGLKESHPHSITVVDAGINYMH